MISKFLAHYRITGKEKEVFDSEYQEFANKMKLYPELYELLKEHGGLTVNNGLYRIQNIRTCLYWTEIISRYFNIYDGKIFSIGFDWLGNHFAYDTSRLNSNIILLDPTIGKSFIIPVSGIEEFHNYELVENKTESLVYKEFEEYVVGKNISLGFSQCISYQIPLFTGGRDNYENYEITDIEMMWDMNYLLSRSINNEE